MLTFLDAACSRKQDFLKICETEKNVKKKDNDSSHTLLKKSYS